MSDARIRAVVEAIHSSPTQAVLFLSGGASQVIGWLLSVPGASNTVLETVIPSKFCSEDTAEDMALLAYNRALKLSSPGSPVLGVGFTGSLASARPKIGDHSSTGTSSSHKNGMDSEFVGSRPTGFHLSTRTADRLCVSTVTLSKGLRTREQEDKVSSHLLLKAIANACRVPATFDSGLTESEVSDECEKQFDEDQELEQLINGQICFKIYPFAIDTDMSTAERKIILSGSFNPLHDGHLKLLEVAARSAELNKAFTNYSLPYDFCAFLVEYFANFRISWGN
uniref:Cytidyltransferase-like domain-containing protein n=1 Tax=Fagus sylvatica TaxID=28930 RepID=A0A2N9IDF8_FAGSY